MLIRTDTSSQKFSLSRRTLLRGAAGVAVALPMLEMMVPSTARAQAALPHRYVVMFAGVSTGRNQTPSTLPPSQFGSNYTATRSLTSLAAQGV
jgi:hypothetical protein